MACRPGRDGGGRGEGGGGRGVRVDVVGRQQQRRRRRSRSRLDLLWRAVGSRPCSAYLTSGRGQANQTGVRANPHDALHVLPSPKCSPSTRRDGDQQRATTTTTTTPFTTISARIQKLSPGTPAPPYHVQRIWVIGMRSPAPQH